MDNLATEIASMYAYITNRISQIQQDDTELFDNSIRRMRESGMDKRKQTVLHKEFVDQIKENEKRSEFYRCITKAISEFQDKYF